MTSFTETAARPVSFWAVPDSGEVDVKILDDGIPKPVLPNILAVPFTLRAKLTAAARQMWYPPQRGVQPPPTQWIFNQCADADEYRSALIWLDETYGDTVPVFNHPRAVALSRRDHSAAALRGIEGLTVPHCGRFRATSRAAFELCFTQHGFRYPVLVRPCAGQTGRGLIRIDGPRDWERAVQTRWFGQPHFMTEFVDFATADGLYLKARVLFVGDRFFIRHVKGAASWKVHSRTASSMADFKDREHELINELNASEAFTRVCAAVFMRTGLDFCGMDVGVDPARKRFVMFECNAAMSVFADRVGQAGGAERQARRDRLVAPVVLAYEQHLREPDAWAWRRSPLSRAGGCPPCRELLADEAG
jgi:glutathione synthase/RimK-type ligase-like ATP-grasp enzyme